MLEECISEAYIRLRIPRPVGISQKGMEHYREEYADERLIPPIKFPEGMGPGTYEEEEEAEREEAEGIASVGEYTKATSQLTEADFYQSFFNN